MFSPKTTEDRPLQSCLFPSPAFVTLPGVSAGLTLTTWSGQGWGRGVGAGAGKAGHTLFPGLEPTDGCHLTTGPSFTTSCLWNLESVCLKASAY